MRRHHQRLYSRTHYLLPHQAQPHRFQLASTPEKYRSNKESVVTFRNTAKVFAFLTIFTGVFGLCYQKGMVHSMNLGNMAGNYDTQEVFISALSGYMYIFENLTEVTAEAIFVDIFWPTFALLLILSTVFVLSLQYKDKIRATASQLKAKISLRDRNSLSSKILLPAAWLSSLATAGAVSLIQVISVYTILATFAILLIPSALGHAIGAKKATEAINNPPCIDASEINQKSNIIRQCTHLKIDGKELSGKIMLENISGYFMRLNTGFIYASKDGKTCIYSKDTQTEGKDLDEFNFEKDQIDGFCREKTSRLQASKIPSSLKTTHQLEANRY